jgi:hypothetical protein
MEFSAGRPIANVATFALAHGVLKAMIVAKGKALFGILCAVAALTAAAGAGASLVAGDDQSLARSQAGPASEVAADPVSALLFPNRKVAPRRSPEQTHSSQVSVKETEPSFVIQGRIAVPGKYPLKKNDTALDAIQRAGGLESGADGRSIRLVRSSASGEATLTINYEAIKYAGEMSTNHSLKPGDRIVVDFGEGAKLRLFRTTNPPKPLRSDSIVRFYAVEDLARAFAQGEDGSPGDPVLGMERLRTLILNTIEPETWNQADQDEAPGRGSIRVTGVNQSLAIRHNIQTHDKIVVLLRGLRQARGMLDPKQVSRLISDIGDDGEATEDRVEAINKLSGIDATFQPDVERILIERLRADRSEEVRGEAARVLGSLQGASAKVGRSLEIVIAGDDRDAFPPETSPAVRKAAERALRTIEKRREQSRPRAAEAPAKK